MCETRCCKEDAVVEMLPLLMPWMWPTAECSPVTYEEAASHPCIGGGRQKCGGPQHGMSVRATSSC
jgi:hypothetical protein